MTKAQHVYTVALALENNSGHAFTEGLRRGYRRVAVSRSTLDVALMRHALWQPHVELNKACPWIGPSMLYPN
jgi:hypothetical protein